MTSFAARAKEGGGKQAANKTDVAQVAGPSSNNYIPSAPIALIQSINQGPAMTTMIAAAADEDQPVPTARSTTEALNRSVSGAVGEAASSTIVPSTGGSTFVERHHEINELTEDNQQSNNDEDYDSGNAKRAKTRHPSNTDSSSKNGFRDPSKPQHSPCRGLGGRASIAVRSATNQTKNTATTTKKTEVNPRETK